MLPELSTCTCLGPLMCGIRLCSCLWHHALQLSGVARLATHSGQRQAAAPCLATGYSTMGCSGAQSGCTAAVHSLPDWRQVALCRPVHHLPDTCDLMSCRRGRATPGSGVAFEAAAALTRTSQAPSEAASLSARAVLEQAACRRRAAAAKYDGVQFGMAPVGSSTRWEEGSILATTGDFTDLVGTSSSGVQPASPPRERWWPDDEKASR